MPRRTSIHQIDSPARKLSDRTASNNFADPRISWDVKVSAAGTSAQSNFYGQPHRGGYGTHLRRFSPLAAIVKIDSNRKLNKYWMHMSEAIPYFDLPAQIRSLRKDLDAAIGRTLDNCSFCLGPDVAQFEKDFAKFVGANHCVGFNSGTSALHVAMIMLGVGPGDEVVTTPFTFVATSWAISYVGAKPVFVDIDDTTFNMDPKLVESAITPRTKAMMPVHLYGQPLDLDPLLEIARRKKLPLVEDAAQAHGAIYKGRPVGTFGEMSCFSFYPGKNLGACGEGGALVTNNETYAARARALREHGSTVRYYHDEVGYNYRMEGIQGAVLGVKLKHLARWTERRRAIAKIYNELLSETPLQLPHEAGYGQSAWHLFVVRHQLRDELKKHLDSSGVGSALHYPLPLHLQKCYAWLGYQPGDFPVAEKAARECLSLPIYPELTDRQVQRVTDAIKDFFKSR
jgi:dTDP-4-amino-4,6-dideoxygalactose transaminase